VYRQGWWLLTVERMTLGVKKIIFVHIQKNAKHFCLNEVSLSALRFIKDKNYF
jgi:hypothetical protein